jgi:hypothetical protein
VWREPQLFFYFPLPVMALMLAGLAAAIVYHIRAKRSLADRPRIQAPPPGQSSQTASRQSPE